MYENVGRAEALAIFLSAQAPLNIIWLIGGAGQAFCASARISSGTIRVCVCVEEGNRLTPCT
jgi:hypothetical protein